MRIRLQHICQGTLLESIFVHQLKSLWLLITLMVIIVEFRGSSVKVFSFIALVSTHGGDKRPKIKWEKDRGNPDNTAFQNKTSIVYLGDFLIKWFKKKKKSPNHLPMYFLFMVFDIHALPRMDYFYFCLQLISVLFKIYQAHSNNCFIQIIGQYNEKMKQ